MNRCAITVPRVTRTGTYGTGRAPQRGCIGLHLILYSIHNTAVIDLEFAHAKFQFYLKNEYYTVICGASHLPVCA